MPGVNNPQQDVDIDLPQLFRAIWQRKGRVLAITGIAAVLALGGASLISPTYRSETRILIESRTPVYSKTDPTGTGTETQPLLDELNIASQVQVLQSVDLIKQVARDMKLYEREEFDPTAKSSAMSDILVLLGLKKNPLDLPPEERVIKEFTQKLVVYQVEKSRVIGVQFTSNDPKLAAAIPNAMIKVYLSLQSGAKLDSNSEATRWLEPEIADLREKVREAEQKVADYRASADLMPAGENTSFASRQLTDISAELTRVRGERATAEARAESVRSALSAGRAVDTLTDVVGSQMIQRLKESEANIQAQISDLSTSLLEGHPRLKGLRAQLVGVHTQLNRETQKILTSLENEAKVSQLREQQLVQQLNAVKADSARAGGDEVQLKSLDREATAQRQLLETYLGRYREAASRVAGNSSPADARVISRAVDPQEPYFPKIIPIVIVAALAALVLSSVVIMLMELFSGRALKPVVTATAVPAAVAVVPVVVEDRPVRQPSPVTAVASETIVVDKPVEPVAVERPVVHDERLAADIEAAIEKPPAPAAEPDNDYSIQTVAEYLVEKAARVALSISPSGDDGSTATVMLAREIAEAGRTVVLLDMTGSACPTRLMAETPGLPGITDLLLGNAAFADTIHSDRLSDAHLIPQGNSDVRRAMRGADRLSMIIDALSDAYDLVLVECGAADVEGVARLTHNRQAEIILSVPQPKEEELLAVITVFETAGYEDIIFMSGSRHPSRSRRAAAA